MYHKHNKLIVLGAGGHGRVCYDVAKAMERWQEVYFLDDQPNFKKITEKVWLGKMKQVMNYVDEYDIFVGIGDNHFRSHLLKELLTLNANIVTLIHPSSMRGSNVTIGRGCVCMPRTIINNGSAIGNGSIINTGAIVEHDNVIGNFTHLSPGAVTAGNVSIDDYSWIGLNACIIQGITIGSDVIVGAGSVVIEDISNHRKAVGVPSRIIE